MLRALDDVSFEVAEGEVLGILGHNGAGKSTLLKIIARVTAPDNGWLELRGRVGSLLEVGTGFHPELTGRENVFLNGAVLGMRPKDIRKQLDEILAFAEVEQFADTPVKRYSSGMYTRLAFAVAAHLEAEIMLVDEVLSVGDVSFQAKSLGKMNELASSGRTVVFVSHNLASMRRLCSRCIWLDHGRVHREGDPASLIREYLTKLTPELGHIDFPIKQHVSAQFRSISMLAGTGGGGSVVGSDDAISVELTVLLHRKVPGLHFTVSLQNAEGTLVLTTDVADELPGIAETLDVGEHRFRVELPPRLLAPGQYQVHLGMAAAYLGMIDSQPQSIAFTVVDTTSTHSRERGGVIGLPLPWYHVGEV